MALLVKGSDIGGGGCKWISNRESFVELWTLHSKWPVSFDLSYSIVGEYLVLWRQALLVLQFT